MLIVALIAFVLISSFAVINGALIIAALLSLVSDRIAFTRLALYSVAASVLLTAVAYVLYMFNTMEVLGQGQYMALEQRRSLVHPAFAVAFLVHAVLGALALTFWIRRLLRSFRLPGNRTKRVLASLFLMTHLVAFGLFAFLIFK